MKKILAFTGLTAVAGTGLVFAELKKKAGQLPSDFTVTAHTGSEKTEDNSLESIRAAVEAGADIAEIDLRFDCEGVPVLSHDECPENPVTLAEAFSLIAGEEKIRVNVDVKTTDNMREVYRLSEHYGITDRCFYTGVEESDTLKVKSETPEIPYYLNCPAVKAKKNDGQYIATLIDLAESCGAIGINMHYSGMSKKMSDAIRSRGLKVSLWTANDIRAMLECICLTPDNITTRYPVALRKLINRLK